MNEKIQKILDAELKLLINANNVNDFKTSIARFADLAGILDAMGAVSDADKIDVIIKEAAGSIWDFLLGAGGSGLMSKDQGGEYFGKSLLNAFESGDWGKVLDKQVLVGVVTHALIGGGIAVIATSLLDALADNVPGFSLIKNAKFTKMAIVGALTYAVNNSDFVNKIVDGLIDEIKKALGMEVKQEQNKQKQQALPGVSKAPVQPAAQEGNDTAEFKLVDQS